MMGIQNQNHQMKNFLPSKANQASVMDDITSMIMIIMIYPVKQMTQMFDVTLSTLAITLFT